MHTDGTAISSCHSHDPSSTTDDSTSDNSTNTKPSCHYNVLIGGDGKDVLSYFLDVHVGQLGWRAVGLWLRIAEQALHDR